MGHLFISYSRRDTDVVNQLVNQLETAGYETWIDLEGIRGGDQWRRQIVEAVESADVFILALSKDSVTSINVRKELDLAEGKGLRVIPVEIKSVAIPAELKYQLVGLQRIDLVSDFDAGFVKLLEALEG